MRVFALGINLIATMAFGADWPQWMGPNRDAVWSETGVLSKFPEGGPKVLWRTPIRGGYAGPAVVGGKVYVTDFVTEADFNKAPFDVSPKPGTERVLCLDSATGKEIWKHEYPCTYKLSYACGPRCTPTIHEGKVYSLGAEGDLFCLDAEKGSVVWSKNFAKEYKAKTPYWGYAGHPLVDGKKLICVVGGSGSTAVAFDKDTGKEIWKSLDAKNQGYAPPSIIEAGGARQLLVWHGEALEAIDPETGKPLWNYPLKTYQSMSIMTPQRSGDTLFVGAVFGTSVGLKLASDKPAATESWKIGNKKGVGLQACNMTPFVDGDVMYGVDHAGQFRGVEVATGKHLWESWLPVTGKKESRAVNSATVFVVKNSDRYFLFNDSGELLIAKLSKTGYEELGRAKILEPTGQAFGRNVVWSHPAYADRKAFLRNDKEIVAISLAE
ncbi:MAG TPA: PQQ-binding-like beta-propeller repeat protein [Planctomycetia bacterium]|nr:PQQ-binding-like beta-propeller repeat protein [Planctomycetia bacterium]